MIHDTHICMWMFIKYKSSQIIGSELDLKKMYSIRCVRGDRLNSNWFTEDLKLDVNL